MKRKAPSCRGPMNQHQSISKSKQKQKRNQTNFKNNAVAFFVLLCLTTSTTTTHALEPTADEQTNTNTIMNTNTNMNMNMNMNIPTSFQPSNYNSPKNENHLGPIDDSTCHVEQLEEANDSQLFAILHDLKNTAFFRNFAVDLDAKCPLKWNKDQKDQKGKEPKDNSGASASGSENGNGKSSFNSETKSKNKATDKGSFGTSSSGKSSPFNTHKPGPNFLGGFGSGGDTDADEGKCAGGLEEQDPDDKLSACHVDLGGESPTIPFPLPVPVPVPEMKSTETKSKTKATDKTATKTTTTTTTTTAEEELDFECDGGSVAEEVEDDAPPLCELTESEMTEYYENAESKTQSKTPLQDMLYSALDSLNFNKWDFNSESEYKSQLKTFMWSKKTDPVVISHKSEEACEDDFNAVEGRLPDTFWLDMCAHIKEGEGIKMVDLTLNPERNTGYNGTHIWNAIYGENCIDMIDGYGSVDQPMCYEERFLYRLLSGLHASTTLSIAKNYYPPNKRKGRKNWEPNALYFYEQFGDHPEYIRNLHFSYVVLLRALKKAYPILNKYEIRTGNIVEDETAMILLRRLLDSSILKSCSGVFSAFDETLMFRKQDEVETTSASKFKSAAQSKFPKDEVITIQQNFKGVFHNISSILDCVQCQQCKLHGKMAMLGYGTALKILFMTNEELIHKSLNRNEIVAFMNTIAKMSEALKDVRELTNLYWVEHVDKKKVPVHVEPPTVAVGGGVGVGIGAPTASDNPLDAAIGATATLASLGMIGAEREAELVKLALERDEGILALAKHYASNLDKFLMLSQSIGSVVELSPPDAIIVGTGLAGLAAALNILDRGGKVLIVEKEHRLGGNSNKASSGINACCPNNSSSTDYAESFIADTTKSAGDSAQPELISTLVGNSAKAVTWLKERVGVDLSLVAQLGGHSHKRTHRPKNGMVGAEVIYGMQRAVKEYEKSGRVEILTDTKVINLLKDDKGSVVGLEVEYLSTEKRDNPKEFYSPNVILATGGFAADRTDESYLSKYRPELVNMPATAGSFSTGDGIGLATAVGADLVDMDKVQIHPTGWVDPKDPSNPNKVLSAELMRGVGGILINNEGKRFCNELGTRAYVSNSILSHDSFFKENGVWDKSNEIPTVSLVLSSSAAADGKKHVDHYVHKGLLTKFEGLRALAEWMGQDIDVLRATLEQYRSDASNGSDEWGKTSFQGKPGDDINNEVFYAGMITPVLHYCMGGITIDNEGNVLDENRNPISGLHAAGEVTGGVHGINRLGGNSLLECTVYGTIVGNKIPIRKSIDIPRQVDFTNSPTPKKLEEISQTSLEQHSSEDDCWVAIHGYVYDLASFAEEHPAGAESIFKLCGSDGTEAFQSVHNKKMMDDFEEDKVGIVS